MAMKKQIGGFNPTDPLSCLGFAPTHAILRPLRAKILQPFTRGDLSPVAKIGRMQDLA
jgi:hypothetical protein